MSEISRSATLPNQVMTKAQKIKAFGSEEGWSKESIDFFISCAYYRGSYWNEQNNSIMLPGYTQKGILYDVYAGNHDFESMKAYQKPFMNKDLVFPEKPKVFNIIKPVIDELRNEELKRPFPANVYASNRDITNKREQRKIEMEAQKDFIEYVKGWEQYGIKLDERMMKDFQEEFQTFFESNGLLWVEKLGSDILGYLFEKTNFAYKMNEAFFHLLVTDSEYIKIDTIGDEPIIRLVNPLYVAHNIPNESIFVQDCGWFVEQRLMSIHEIIQEFSETLSENEVLELNKLSESFNASISTPSMVSTYERWRNSLIVVNNTPLISVYNVEWISQSKVNIVERKDPLGFTEKTVHFGSYKKKEGDINVESKWINETWEGVRIGYGNCIYTKIQKRKNQFRSIDNPAIAKLSYRGIHTTNINTIPRSLTSYGMIYQELYNIIWYKIEREIAKSKGKITTIDMAQIPHSKGMGFEEVLYYMQADGIRLINSLETMSETGSPAGFNQFNDSDSGMSQTVTQLLQILVRLIQEWEELSGVSKQRKGEVHNSETVGGVERAVSQSVIMTERYYWLHSLVKRDTCLGLLDEAKFAFKKGKMATYALGENQRSTLKVMPDEISFVDWGLSIGDITKQNAIMQKMEQWLPLALQSNSATILDAIEITKAHSVAGIEAALKQAFTRQEQVKAQEMQQQMQMMQQQQQMNVELEKMKMQSAEKMNNEDNQIKLQIAELQKELGILKTLVVHKEGIIRATIDAQKAGMNPDNELIKKLEQELEDTITESGDMDSYYKEIGNLIKSGPQQQPNPEQQQPNPEQQQPNPEQEAMMKQQMQQQMQQQGAEMPPMGV